MGTCLALHEAEQKNIEAEAQIARGRAHADQIIIAFLSLKLKDVSVEVRERLVSVMGRVQAIALAHDLLSIGRQTSSVDFADYLRSLCANIDPQRPDLTIEVEAQPVQVPIDRAVPAGLVVNELVTNSTPWPAGQDAGCMVARRAPAGPGENAMATTSTGATQLKLSRGVTADPLVAKAWTWWY
jgi:Histidine kinase